MSKICVSCVKEINDKEVMCISCHQKVLESAEKQIKDYEFDISEYKKLVDVQLCRIQELENELELTQKALKLCVIDKCYFENCYFDELLDLDGCKVKIPKKEQWYLEQAEKKKGDE